jgi:hypothetical protein
MKRNLLISLLLVGTIFALNSCKKEYLVEVKGTVSGNVREYYTNQALSGVLVRIVSDDKTMLKDSTDASGYFSISGVPSGYHYAIFSKAGYATVRGYVEIESPDEVANTTKKDKPSYHYGQIIDAELAPLTGKADGVVTLPSGAAASGVNIVAYFSDYGYNGLQLEPALYSTTTDGNGLYSFANLPLNTSVTFTAYNTTASGSSTAADLTFLQASNPSHNDISMSDEALYLINFTGKGGSDVYVDTAATSIVLTFSENINQAISESKNSNNAVWITSVSAGGAKLLTSTAYSSNIVTITLPAGSLARGTDYYIHYNVYSSDTKNANGTGSFKTTDKGASIAKTAATLTYTDPNIVVSNLPAITGMPAGTVLDFDVYYRAYGDDLLDYRKITVGAITGTTNRTIQASGAFAPGRYYVIPKVTGLNGITVYGIPSNVTERPNP